MSTAFLLALAILFKLSGLTVGPPVLQDVDCVLVEENKDATFIWISLTEQNLSVTMVSFREAYVKYNGQEISGVTDGVYERALQDGGILFDYLVNNVDGQFFKYMFLFNATAGGVLSICQAKCLELVLATSFPEPPENGTVIFAYRRSHNETVCSAVLEATFACNPGYVLNGTSVIEFTDGSWGVPIPSCIKLNDQVTVDTTNLYWIFVVLVVLIAVACGFVVFFLIKRYRKNSNSESTTTSIPTPSGVSKSTAIPCTGQSMSHGDEQKRNSEERIRRQSLPTYSVTRSIDGQTAEDTKGLAHTQQPFAQVTHEISNLDNHVTTSAQNEESDSQSVRITVQGNNMFCRWISSDQDIPSGSAVSDEETPL